MYVHNAPQYEMSLDTILIVPHHNYTAISNTQIMGDGIGGPVLSCLSGDTFEMSVTHFRKDNAEQYDNIERIKIAKVDDPQNPQYAEMSKEDLERALKGKFVSCNVQYRDEKTDILVCNVFVQKPPEGF